MNNVFFIKKNSPECSDCSQSELPLFIQESIKRLEEGYERYKSDKEYDHFDADIDELTSSINAVEVEDLIPHTYAEFLRKKYLGWENPRI